MFFLLEKKKKKSYYNKRKVAKIHTGKYIPTNNFEMILYGDRRSWGKIILDQESNCSIRAAQT